MCAFRRCARCGEHTYRYRWHSEIRREGPAEEWAEFYPDLEQPHLYWFRICWPSCRANSLWMTLHQVEGFLVAAAPQLENLVTYWFERLRRSFWIALNNAEQCD